MNRDALAATVEAMDRMFPGAVTLNKAQAARVMGIGRQTIYRLINNGEIRFNQFGRITKEDLARQISLDGADEREDDRWT